MNNNKINIAFSEIVRLVGAGKLSDDDVMSGLNQLIDLGHLPELPALRLVDIALEDHQIEGGYPVLYAVVDLEGIAQYDITYHVGKHKKPYFGSFRAEAAGDGFEQLCHDVVLAHMKVDPNMSSDAGRRMRLALSRWVSENVSPRVVRAYEVWQARSAADGMRSDMAAGATQHQAVAVPR